MYSSARKLPSVKLLNELFIIDGTSPTGLRYKSNVGTKIKSGNVAGAYASTSNRYVVGFNYRKLQVSRVIWKILTGKDPKNVIDHIDNNPLNNNISNLRDITQRENTLNRKDRKINA